MRLRAILAIAGALCGTVGSIITAFSVNSVLRELHLAQEFLNVTAEALATDQRDVPVFTGTDRRFGKAESRSSKILSLGVALLAIGFILQAASVLVG
jgi:hypothetical protein